jgi:hypothetical protein
MISDQRPSSQIQVFPAQPCADIPYIRHPALHTNWTFCRLHHEIPQFHTRDDDAIMIPPNVSFDTAVCCSKQEFERSCVNLGLTWCCSRTRSFVPIGSRHVECSERKEFGCTTNRSSLEIVNASYRFLFVSRDSSVFSSSPHIRQL